MILAVLGFGSNLGNRKQNILNAYEILECKLNVRLTKSSFYETEPWGIKSQPKFINSAAFFYTNILPEKIMEIIQHTENLIGRKRQIKWGPRIIDVDFLFYGDCILKESNLVIPHPYIHERKFVLEPLVEIIPHFLHPELKTTVSDLYKRLK